ncbi:small subunit ribosomal protein S4 [Verrucomicrobium sp. GAS474]|uniref:30S ribosomal protein S4 n=1 Tax=Verrucomicrobium sp. GAS474 TaxID=1882831 RepID=UPI00087C4E84|nr:30S ribosomal protein S4 [Verrucomicrobium sp. GAS474]SDU25750.1 small subunit ribosomal protein S4 [Verrucomicrobium sp. GAS474]
MARYTGPRTKKSRRFGAPIFGPSKALERRPYAPGQHGEKSRRKVSEYGVALGEKQKLKLMYGVLERQFRRYFEAAQKKRGVTGLLLLQILESRLDNVVFRLGLANSRRSARQFISHGHILVNGKKVTIASYNTKPSEVVEVVDKPNARKLAEKNLEIMQIAPVPAWLSLDKGAFKGEIQRIPSREEIAPIANEQLVVELYSR